MLSATKTYTEPEAFISSFQYRKQKTIPLSLIRNSQKMFTMKSYQPEKFERKDDSKLNLYVSFCWLLFTKKESITNT